MNLSKKRCVPCEGNIKKFSNKVIKNYLKKIKNWKYKNNKIYKEFKFKDFKETLKFVNKVSNISEKEGHHPNIYFTWGKCKIEVYTHAINGLSENDFILAAKIDEL
jgi:4a-hydroxytetrahydrobiopterin dehydratase